MNKYAIRYCEILAKTIIAEADTYEEAEEKVQAAVDDCRIVLDMEDYDECEKISEAVLYASCKVYEMGGKRVC